MSLAIQLNTMLSMAAMGIWLGAAIDTYNRFSPRSPSFRWFLAIQDFVFWLVQGLLIFYVLLLVNFGEVRFYIFLAICCGFAMYQGLFKGVYKKMLERVILLVVGSFTFSKKVVQVLFITPTKWLLKLLFGFCMMILSTTLTIFLFIFKVIWKPIGWLLLLLYRLLGLKALVAFIQSLSFFKKTKGILEKVWKMLKKG